MALWGHFSRPFPGAHCCCHVGWFTIRVCRGIIIRLVSDDFIAAIGAFALLSVLSEFLHVEIKHLLLVN